MTGTFTAGSVLTAANLNTAINSLTLNAQSGAGYTLVLTDAGKLVTVSNASAQNLTIPLNSSVAYATGTVIEVLNIGAGTWTLTPTGGVTLTGSASVPTSARVRLTKTGTDTWYANTLGGGLAHITTSTFSAASTVSVNNCFTSAYENYRVMLNLTNVSGASANVQLRLRVGGVDTATNYAYSRVGTSYNNTVAGDGATAATQLPILYVVGTFPVVATFDVLAPVAAVRTNFTGAQSFDSGAQTMNGQHQAATAFDGFTIAGPFGGANTISGTVRVYGYQN